MKLILTLILACTAPLVAIAKDKNVDLNQLGLDASFPNWNFRETLGVYPDLENPDPSVIDEAESLQCLIPIGFTGIGNWVYDDDDFYVMEVGVKVFRNTKWLDEFLAQEYKDCHRTKIQGGNVLIVAPKKYILVSIDNFIVDIALDAPRDLESVAQQVISRVCKKMNIDVKPVLAGIESACKATSQMPKKERKESPFIRLDATDSHPRKDEICGWCKQFAGASSEEISRKIEEHYPNGNLDKSIRGLINELKRFKPLGMYVCTAGTQVVCQADNLQTIFVTNTFTDDQSRTMGLDLLPSDHEEFELLVQFLRIMGGKQVNPRLMSGFFFRQDDTPFPLHLDEPVWNLVSEADASCSESWKTASAIFCSVTGDWILMDRHANVGWYINSECRIEPISMSFREFVLQLTKYVQSGRSLSKLDYYEFREFTN